MATLEEPITSDVIGKTPELAKGKDKLFLPFARGGVDGQTSRERTPPSRRSPVRSPPHRRERHRERSRSYVRDPGWENMEDRLQRRDNEIARLRTRLAEMEGRNQVVAGPSNLARREHDDHQRPTSRKRSLSPTQSVSGRRQRRSIAFKRSWVTPTDEASSSHPTPQRLLLGQKSVGVPLHRGRSQRTVTLDDGNIRIIRREGGKPASQGEVQSGDLRDYLVDKAMDRLERRLDERLATKQDNRSVNKLLEHLYGTPFTAEIEDVDPPTGFTMPKFTRYDGKSDPVDHISHYRQAMSLYRKNDALLCTIFPSSLGQMGLRWFDRLPRGSITSWLQLQEAFLARFKNNTTTPKNNNDLLALRKGGNESLKEYSRRYWDVYNNIENCNEALAVESFQYGLELESPLKISLTK